MDPRRSISLAAALVLAACSPAKSAGPSSITDASDTSTATDTSTSADTADTTTPADATPAATPLRPCPASGKGAVAGPFCYLLTPAESGLPAAGVNAAVDQYALRPASGARGKLLLFFNGSGGSPIAGTRGTPAQNFYATARAAGLHVLAVSYRSDNAIGTLCKGSDACFWPTRETILTGAFQPGASPTLSAIADHEGAYARIAAGLKALAERDPQGGWDGFVDPAAAKPSEQIRWTKVIASGHSQGGGHAAAIARSFAIDRVVTLSSPCDQTLAGPATWLNAAKTAYATSPAAAFHGLGRRATAFARGMRRFGRCWGWRPSASTPTRWSAAARPPTARRSIALKMRWCGVRCCSEVALHSHPAGLYWPHGPCRPRSHPKAAAHQRRCCAIACPSRQCASAISVGAHRLAARLARAR